MARRAIEPTTLLKPDGSILQIDKGTCILPNLPVLHKNTKYWGSDSEKFNPDRFLPENNQDRHSLTWLSFGAGPRMCSGKNLAIHETKAIMVYLLRVFKFELDDSFEVCF